jgi:hypothetical protein
MSCIKMSLHSGHVSRTIILSQVLTNSMSVLKGLVRRRKLHENTSNDGCIVVGSNNRRAKCIRSSMVISITGDGVMVITCGRFLHKHMTSSVGLTMMRDIHRITGREQTQASNMLRACYGEGDKGPRLDRIKCNNAYY